MKISLFRPTPAQKQIIKQEVIDAVVSGTPMQFAVQQAIQNVATPETIDDTAFLNGDSTIDEIIANL